VETDLYSSVEKWDKAINVLDRYEKQFGISEPAINFLRFYSIIEDLSSLDHVTNTVQLINPNNLFFQDINVLDRYEKQFGISEPAIIEKAKLYSKMNDVKNASVEIMKLVKKYPEKTDYLGLLAELYLYNNQLNKVVQNHCPDHFLRFYSIIEDLSSLDHVTNTVQLISYKK